MHGQACQGSALIIAVSWTWDHQRSFQKPDGKEWTILLMVQKSVDHQLRLVVYPFIYRVYTSQVVQDFFHQQ